MALYLKYRPQTFSDLTGQDFIKNTLKAAIQQDKTVGAYLFTGPRGTGKTSTARIFAKAVNCSNSQQGDPCNSCEICQGFNDDKLIDIIEIDAASHTGVDNIRDIIEKAQFQPTQCKYKIYIVDEVHMLSKGAFNALLKILEEPPKHVKFILATTEIHKVPDTILSRCQRYDFKNFSPEDIISRLKYIAESENISVDDASYNYIVKNSGGGMRNAVSLFEQLISEEKISYDYIVGSLGISSEEEKSNFIEKLQAKNPEIMTDFEEMLSGGKNLKIFFTDILYALRNISLKKLESGQDISSELTLLEGLQETLMKSKNSFDEALTFQIGLLKIINPKIISQNESFSSPQSGILSPPREKGTTGSLEKMQPLSLEKGKVKEGELARLSGNGSKAENSRESGKKDDIAETNIEEIENIFGTSQSVDPENSVSSDRIDINKIISEAKTLGAKAALTMSLKGSDISKDQNDVLQIKTKTKIALGSISKTENREILLSAIEKLGITFSDIKIS